MKIVVAILALTVIAAGCTLLLPTEQLIIPCVADEDCEAGFECLENACLPLDDGESASG